MTRNRSGLVIVLGLCASAAIAQEPGPHFGVNGGAADGSGAAGVNVGYAFNDIVGLDAEYSHVFGDDSGDLISAFVTLTTTGATYVKGKIGGTAASGDSFDGSSGSAGIGFGHTYGNGWVLEVDLNQYASDVSGGNLLVKKTF